MFPILLIITSLISSRTELYDFHQPKTIDKSFAYKYLFEWIKNYFQQQNRNDIIHPLYIQHEGIIFLKIIVAF
jgi:hypothetical protein